MPYTTAELEDILQQLLEDWESETVEFKQGGEGYSTDKIGKYFSALANEANLRDVACAWLVFGVNDKTRKIEGTGYRPDSNHLHSLKQQIGNDTEPSVTLREIYELESAKGRVILFQIPAAPKGLPIAWKGHFYAREGESLAALGVDKQDEIRNQSKSSDWSAEIVQGASINDLDPEALELARQRFAEKYANRFSTQEVNAWTDAAFLDRAKVTISGQVKVTIYGRVIDAAYSRLLIQKTELSLPEIIGLDRVQKGLTLDAELLKRLRKGKLVEGRKNSLHVAADIAEATASKADYIKKRGFDDAHYEKLICEYLQKFGNASRKEIDELLLDKLSDALDEKQKLTKINNLLTKLRKDSVIHNTASKRTPAWALLNGEK